LQSLYQKHLKMSCKYLFVFIIWGNILLAYSDEPVKLDKETINLDENGYESLSKLFNIMQIVREKYIDKDKTTYDKLIKGALKGMLSELDQYSIYEDEKSLTKTIEQTSGVFGGLGIIVSTAKGSLEIKSVLKDTPAFVAKVKPGDIIIEIEGKRTSKMSIYESTSILKGKVGTKVSFKVFRAIDDTTKEFTIERAVIKVSPIKGVKLLKNKIAYLRITQFSKPTSQKLNLALKNFRKEGAKGLVIDLRNNPGGLLVQAIKSCSLFLEEGSLIVSTEGRMDTDKASYFSNASDKYLDIPIVVLINSNSASASEIMAGCLKDSKRAIIIGETSYGKGVVQSFLRVSNKSAIRFTTSEYFTPSHKTINEEGVSPNIEVVIVPEDNNYKIAYQMVEYPGVVLPDIEDAVRDIQLERAIDVLTGISLFSQKND